MYNDDAPTTLIQCRCRKHPEDEAQPSCHVCGGTGYVRPSRMNLRAITPPSEPPPRAA